MLILTEGAVDWPSSSSSQDQEGGGSSWGRTEEAKLFFSGVWVFCGFVSVCVFVFFLNTITQIQWPLPQLWWLGTYLPPSIWRFIALFFWVFNLAWPCFGCYTSVKWGGMLFLLMIYQVREKLSLLCVILGSLENWCIRPWQKCYSKLIPRAAYWALQIFLMTTLLSQFAKSKL